MYLNTRDLISVIKAALSLPILDRKDVYQVLREDLILIDDTTLLEFPVKIIPGKMNWLIICQPVMYFFWLKFIDNQFNVGPAL